MHRPMPTPIRLSADHARRFLVRRHLLAPPRSLPAQPASVLSVVERLGSLQFDPLEVPGARNHDLVLHARIAGYRREWCDTWLYGADRRLIELAHVAGCLRVEPTSLKHRTRTAFFKRRIVKIRIRTRVEDFL